MIVVNVGSLTALCRTYLPGMLQRGTGRIMNVASTAAFQPGPLMAVYYATKAYVLSFSEALAEETRGSGVTVTALCPGPTESGFQARAAMEQSKLVHGKKLPSSASVAAFGVKAMQRGDVVAVPGLPEQGAGGIDPLHSPPRGPPFGAQIAGCPVGAAPGIRENRKW